MWSFSPWPCSLACRMIGARLRLAGSRACVPPFALRIATALLPISCRSVCTTMVVSHAVYAETIVVGTPRPAAATSAPLYCSNRAYGTSVVALQSKKKAKADPRGGASKSAAPTSASSSAGAAGNGKSSAGGSSASSSRAGGGIEGDIVFSVRNLGKTLPGGRVLFQDISLAFQRSAKIGLLGLNGSGKSSLLKILAGVDTEYDGTAWKADLLRVGYLQQEPQLDASKNVHDNILDGLREKTSLLADYDRISSAMADPDADLDVLLEEQARIQGQIDHFDCWDLNHTITMAKQALRVPPDEADVTLLSGGERRRVALCRLLLEQPDVLLLDEPTNHLDAESVAWLERFLKDYKGTVIAITHDRYFLDNVAGWILEIDRGSAYPYQGNYSVWLEKKSSRLDVEKKQERKKAKAMEEELTWIRQGVRGRQSKSKARVSAYEKLVTASEESRSRDKFQSGAIVIPPAPRLGELVLSVKGVSKSFEGKKLLDNASFEMPKGAVVGIIGGNGTGKTTLLRMITGELQPDAGGVTLGKSVKLGIVSQSRDELVDNQRVIDVVGGGSDTVLIGDYEMPVRQYLASFNLVGELQTKVVKSLSGGERNRVHLARVLKTGANLLMLDEPTNDLDVDTLRSLEEALEDYTGCALIVSHDRFFLDRVASHMLVFLGDGKIEWFDGNYSEYELHAAKSGTRVPTAR